MIFVLIVLGYDPLLSPYFLQTEIPAVSHKFFFTPLFAVTWQNYKHTN